MMQYENATEAELCREAIMVQDASNLLGVTNSFHWLVVRLRALNLNVETHPAAILFLDKVMDLMHVRLVHDRTAAFGPAYERCKEIGRVR